MNARSAVVAVVLAATAGSQQGPGVSVTPLGERSRPLRAPEILTELQPGLENGGARLSGDVDGDGDVDLLMFDRVSGSFWPHGMQTWLNDGQGGFTFAFDLPFDVAPGNSQQFDLANQAFLADVTADGVLDLIYERKDITLPTFFSHVGPSGVLIHPGQGDGSFGAPLLISEGSQFNGAPGGSVINLAVADREGDGHLDLWINLASADTGMTNFVRWWTWSGAAFAPSPHLDTAALRPLRAAVVDLEGDGADEVVTGTFDGYDELLVFDTVGGAPALHATVALPPEVHDINQYLKSGDLDGDGLDDDVLLVFDDFVDTDAIHFVRVLDTGAGFQTTLQVEPNPTFDPIARREGLLVDWDEDGDADYVSTVLSWLENDAGAFTLAAREYSAYSGSYDSALQVADFDGDGNLDAIVEWMMSFGDGGLPGPGSVPPWENPTAGGASGLADWDADGDLDFVHPFSLALNRGDGELDGRSTFPPGLSQPTATAGWCDVDGDGIRDLILTVYEPLIDPHDPLVFQEMRTYVRDDRGDYGLSSTPPSTVQMSTGGVLVSADVDGDGDQDVLAVDGYWANDGGGGFGTAPVAAFSGTPLAALELDGDADVDLLVARAGRLETLRNLGGGAFTTAQDLGPWSAALVHSFLDYDADGDLDLVTARPLVADGLEVLERLDPGTFAPAFSLDVPEPQGPAGLLDADGDGRLDLVVGSRVDATFASVHGLSAWLRGPGGFVERREWVVRQAPVSFGDVDGDGDVDALGTYLVENYAFDGPRAGAHEQYDLGVPGANGVFPVLGARGPLRPGSAGALLVTRGLGGAAGFLLTGLDRAAIPTGTYPGVTLFVDPVLLTTPIALAADGTTELPVAVDSSLAGRTFTLQAVLADPGAAAGWSSTNGLEVRFGSSIASGPPHGAGVVSR